MKHLFPFFIFYNFNLQNKVCLSSGKKINKAIVYPNFWFGGFIDMLLHVTCKKVIAGFFCC